MTYYPYIIHVPGWRFRLEALHACSTKVATPNSPPEEPTELEIALAIRIKDLEIGLRTVIDRVDGVFNSPRLRGLAVTDLDADVVGIAKRALEAAAC